MTYTDEQIAAFPKWLQKLVKMSPEGRQAAGYDDEDLDQAAKAHHLDRDYTQKSQKAAEIEKIQERYPGMSLDKAGELWAWWAQNGSEVNELWSKRGQAKEPVVEQRPTGGKRRSWREVEPSHLYETASLREQFESLDEDIMTRTTEDRKKWFETEIGPRWDKQAGGYLETVLDLMEFSREEAIRAGRDQTYSPLPMNEILKASAARGEKDYRKVAKDLYAERDTLRKTGFEEGRAKGLEEGKKAAEGPSGPMGAGLPSWKPETNGAAPKTREERAAAVFAKVEAKHGKPLPL